ncbi:hypothetical protein AN641_05435 [Candidatus Epulonipiscioides gigas]|nr:hypothetical protein AN641_05435 [Epulopiscium sp. SCG-C07WGA-EpuloA2]
MYNRGHWKSIIELDNNLTVASNDELTAINKVGDENTYTTDVLSTATIDFIKNRDIDKPFLYLVSIPDPHTPVNIREPYASMYNPDDIILPENFYKYNAHWAPNGTVQNDQNNGDETAAKEWMALYFCEVSYIDDNVGRILEALENEHILDDTIVVFTTDHGEYMGEHGLWRKGQLYPEVNHIPFFIRYPKKINANTKISEYVSAVDFLITMTSLAEIDNTSCDVGQDASVLFQDNNHWDGTQYLTSSTFSFSAISKEAIFVGFRQDEYNLMFDMEKDPLNNNLYNAPKYFDIKKKLYEKLLNFETKLNTPTCVVKRYRAIKNFSSNKRATPFCVRSSFLYDKQNSNK